LGLTVTRLLSLAVAVISVGGCVPFHAVDRPGITGSVIDGATSLPIPGASISLKMTSPSGVVTSTDTTASDSLGRFAIPAKRHWTALLVLGPVDFITYFGNVQVDASEYVEVLKDIRSTPGGPTRVDTGPIRLVHRP
jgi:hypothetical protein